MTIGDLELASVTELSFEMRSIYPRGAGPIPRRPTPNTSKVHLPSTGTQHPMKTDAVHTITHADHISQSASDFPYSILSLNPRTPYTCAESARRRRKTLVVFGAIIASIPNSAFFLAFRCRRASSAHLPQRRWFAEGLAHAVHAAHEVVGNAVHLFARQATRPHDHLGDRKVRLL
eukprot:scaffold12479_cov51-Phaeocystis_antarctica.AAC.5